MKKTLKMLIIFSHLWVQVRADVPLTKLDVEIITDQVNDINRGVVTPKFEAGCWDIEAKSADGDCLKRLDGEDLEFLERARLEMASNLDKAISGNLDLSQFIKSTDEAHIANLPEDKQAMVRLILAHHQAETMQNKFEDLKFKYLRAIYLGNEDSLYGELEAFASMYNKTISRDAVDQIHAEQLKANFYSQLKPYLFLKKDEGKGVSFDKSGKPTFSPKYFEETLGDDAKNQQKAKLGREVLLRLYPDQMEKLSFNKSSYSGVDREVVSVGGLVLTNDKLNKDKRKGNWNSIRVVDTTNQYSQTIQDLYITFHQKMENMQRAANKWNSLSSRMKEMGKGSLAQAGRYLTFIQRHQNRVEAESLEDWHRLFPNSTLIEKALEKQKQDVIEDEAAMERLDEWQSTSEAFTEYKNASDELTTSLNGILKYASSNEESRVIMDQYNEFLSKLSGDIDESLTNTKWTTAGVILGAAFLPVVAAPAAAGGASTGAVGAASTTAATGVATALNVALVATPFLMGTMKASIDKFYRGEKFFCSLAKHLPKALGEAGASVATLGAASGLGKILQYAASKGASGLGKVPSIVKLGDSLKKFGSIESVRKANLVIKTGVGAVLRAYVPYKSVETTIDAYNSAKKLEEQASKESILPSGGQAAYEASVDQKENAINGLIGFVRNSVSIGEGFYGAHEKAAGGTGKDFAKSLSDYLEKGVENNVDEAVKAATKEVVEGTVKENKGAQEVIKETLDAAAGTTAAGKVVDIIKKEEGKKEDEKKEDPNKNLIKPVDPAKELK
jgi:hypothetical protein